MWTTRPVCADFSAASSERVYTVALQNVNEAPVVTALAATVGETVTAVASTGLEFVADAATVGLTVTVVVVTGLEFVALAPASPSRRPAAMPTPRRRLSGCGRAARALRSSAPRRGARRIRLRRRRAPP